MMSRLSKIASGPILVLFPALLLGLCSIGFSTEAQAEDFLSALFGAFSRGSPSSIGLPYGSGGDQAQPAPAVRPGGGTAYCVRTCDGRYFPVPATAGESRAEVCSSLCPAGETRVFYGGSIDYATTETGKSYSDLPNAFRYRKEMVAGCTCNGKDSVGLAAVRIEDDRTLHKGDIVAGPHGLVVAAGRVDKRSARNFSPAPAAIRARFARVPVVAAE
jgi:hypothetical protein